jgi:hypothetical protein
MALVDSINKASQKLNSRLGGVSGKIASLLNIGKGILCLPTMVAGFTSSIPGMIGNIKSGVTNAINSKISGAKGLASKMARDAINDKISKFNGIFGAIGAITGAVGAVLGFVGNVKAQVDDILNFIPNKENCNFSGAAIDNCTVQQTLNGVSKRDLRNAAAGLVSVKSLVNKTTKNFGDPASVVAAYADKQIAQLQRAKSVVDKANRII